MPTADAAAGLERWRRFRHGAALVEAKCSNLPLDRAASGDRGVPAAQRMHHLSRADVITGGRMRWGMLTKGRHWRLCWQGALSVAARVGDAALEALDPATRMLDLKIIEPAMGSRHFLLSFVEWLSDRVLQATVDTDTAEPVRPAAL